MTCRRISPVRSPAEPIRTNQGFAHSGTLLLAGREKNTPHILPFFTWLVVSTPLKNISQNGFIFPNFRGENLKYLKSPLVHTWKSLRPLIFSDFTSFHQPTPPLSRAERLQNLWGGFFHHGKFFGFRKSAGRQSGHREFAAQNFSCDPRGRCLCFTWLLTVSSLLTSQPDSEPKQKPRLQIHH